VVVVEGLDVPPEAVVVHYRRRGLRTYQDVSLQRTGVDRHAGEIPASATDALAVRYYIEVVGFRKEWSVALGSAEQPLEVRLVQPEPPRDSGTALAVGLLGAAALLTAAWFWRGERRRRRDLAGRLFWARTLLPIAHLRGAPLTEALNELAGQSLPDPVRGPRRFARPVLQRMLDEVREWDLSQLEVQRARELGPVEPPLLFPTPAKARKRAAPVAEAPQPGESAPQSGDDLAVLEMGDEPEEGVVRPVRAAVEAPAAAPAASEPPGPQRSPAERAALAATLQSAMMGVLRGLKGMGRAAPGEDHAADDEPADDELPDHEPADGGEPVEADDAHDSPAR
jgi:hypothetical protein